VVSYSQASLIIIFLTISDQEYAHISYQAGMAMDPHKTLAACKVELRQMMDRGVFKAIHKKDIGDAIVLPCMMIIKPRDAEYKGRLVASGNLQNRQNFTASETSSATIRTRSILTIIALAANQHLEVHLGDVVGAYLWAALPPGDNIILRLNPTLSKILVQMYPHLTSFVHTNGCLIVKLIQALYGLIQAALLWNKEVTRTMVSLGYRQLDSDECVFIKNVGNTKVIVGLYVDDTIAVHNNPVEYKALLDGLAHKYGALKQHSGNKLLYRGLEIETKGPGTPIRVHQSNYIKDLLLENNITKEYTIPAGPSLFDINVNSPPLTKTDSESYAKCTAKLLWIGTQTRTDIRLPCSFLCSRVLAPTTEDLSKLSRVLGYLLHTSNLGLRFESKGELELECFADASYLVHREDGKSHTGFVIQLAGSTICSESKKQGIVAQSSTEAELIALNSAKNSVLGLRSFLRELGYEQHLPTVIHEDNMAVLTMLEKGRPSLKNQHIAMRFFSASEAIERDQILTTYLNTKIMIADLLTKPLPVAPFILLRTGILNEELKGEEKDPTSDIGLSCSELPFESMGVFEIEGVLKNPLFPVGHGGEVFTVTTQ
jgi:hypothetical protein